MNFFILLKRDLKNLAFNPGYVIFEIGLPILLALILGYLNGSSYRTGFSPYNYYAITIPIFSALYASTLTANNFMERQIKDTNLRVIYSPIRLSYIYISKTIASFLFTSFGIIVSSLYFKFILKTNYGGFNAIYAFIVILATCFMFSSLGAMMCCIFKSEEAANKVQSIFINIFVFLGGVYFPTEGFGKVISSLSWISPAKWTFEAASRIIYDNDLSMMMPLILIYMAVAVGSLIICRLTFKVEDYV